MTLDERIQRYLDHCEPAISGAHGHDTTFRVACALWNGFGLSVEQTFHWLQYYNRKCEPPWSLTDLRHKAEAPQAPTTIHTRSRGYLLGDGVAFETAIACPDPAPPVPKPQYEEAYALAYAARCPQAAEPAYFEIRSPKTAENRTPAGFLHVVFEPDEVVFITTNSHADSQSEDAWLWVNPDPLYGQRLDLDCLDFLRTGYENVWFLANPISGQLHCDERLSKGCSFRCLETISSFRHIVIETDLVSDEVWLPILARLPLLIKAVYHSAKRGYHALVQIDASTREEACQQIELLKPELVRLGACPGTLTPHRLSRLPNCMRSWTDPESGRRVERLQRLVYLNPNPTGQPICELPEREPPWAPWLRWVQAGWSRAQDKGRIIEGLRPFAGLCPQVDSTLKRLEGK
jgi:hypothetical protein